MKYELVFFPRLENGNILWECDSCGNTAEISYSETRAVSIICECTMTCHPRCNHDWYYQSIVNFRCGVSAHLDGS